MVLCPPPFVRDVVGGVNEIDHSAADVVLLQSADDFVLNAVETAVCAFNECEGANCVVFVIDFNGLAGSR